MMRPVTTIRIVRELMLRDGDGMSKRGARQLVEAIPRADARPFARYVLRDLVRYLVDRPRPVAGETVERAHLAAAWLMRAQAATSDGGLSYGYFPFQHAGGWRSSYPETTGYTVASLLEYGARFEQRDAVRSALEMASFVMSQQLPSGATYGGVVGRPDARIGVAFNSGMTLTGLLAAHRHTGIAAFAAAAQRAAEFLANDVDSNGYFQSHGSAVRAHPIKTYTCLCAWPLYEAGRELGEPRYCAAAIAVGDAAIRLQRRNGWFEHNCLSRRPYAPLLHTIGYTLQGLAELGIASGQDRFIEASCRGVEPLLPYCEDGFVYARWFDDWQPAAFSSCLVGAAQVAVVCYRLAAHTGEERYRRAADGAVNFLKAVQPTSATSDADRELVGAIAGSFPLIGAYRPNGYPGWAAKFFLDALLHQHALQLGAATAVPEISGRV